MNVNVCECKCIMYVNTSARGMNMYAGKGVCISLSEGECTTVREGERT